ncbi:hypothetical protein BDV93DRAFT_612096 [Ceratobasidium sp. AG-I]|nr:hypothetical protein BDV93DRAFT_612096 [Ceratobasidium sp. AG-I]
MRISQAESPETAASLTDMPYDTYLEFQASFSTLTGPQLPADPPDAIYEDYGGELAELGNPPPFQTASTSSEDVSVFDEGETGPYHDLFTLGDESTSAIPGAPLSTAAMPGQDAEGYYPWDAHENCLLTAMSAFPRSLFSLSEIEIVKWFATKCGVNNIASQDQLKASRERISELFGSNLKLVESKFGNKFSYNSISTIIAHELANPITSKNLSFFAEDDDPHVSNARRGTKWREEVDNTLAGPMARIHYGKDSYQDYFVNEPALAKLGDSLMPVIISRWFKRRGSLVAQVHRLIPLDDFTGFSIDGTSCISVSADDFHLALPEFRRVHLEYRLPSPDCIPSESPSESVPWTEPTENPKCLKKWNRHNSHLFALAGLPREEVQSPYHVHFMSTSNLAGPQEMLEAIAEESMRAASEGIWAYSAVKRDLVLAIAWWLALEGDNPMQSEISSQVGTGGKLFCRICKVRGKDKDRTDTAEGEKPRLGEFVKVS